MDGLRNDDGRIVVSEVEVVGGQRRRQSWVHMSVVVEGEPVWGF